MILRGIRVNRILFRANTSILVPNRAFYPPITRNRGLLPSNNRTYAQYSRFEDDEPQNKQNNNEEDPNDREFRRKFEILKTYGPAIILVAGGTSWYLAHLEQVPETKRWRYMDTSKAMIKMLEQQSYVELMQEFGAKILPMSHPATKLVQQVADGLISKNGLGSVVTREPTSKGSTDQKPDEWLVYVVNEDIPNAFVMPGRKIVFFSGMFKHVSDENQLAGILAHEVAHQLVGHAYEKVSLSRLIIVVDIFVRAILGADTNLAGLALQALIALPNSRTQELEADLVGLRLMSKACFDPESVITFWRSFDKSDKRQVPQFISTHPGHRQRATAIEGWLPTVRSEYPCVTLADSLAGFNQFAESTDVRSPAIPPQLSSPPPSPRPSPRSSSPRPASPDFRPNSPPSDKVGWGHQDPWANNGGGDSSNGSGDSFGSNAGNDTAGETDWGMHDPWAAKNEKGNKRGSW
ncbi:hypothetical protein FRC14_007571 [Serendipita sp. 396]|nr:hypothetical protein FRC14_007571 [Serendipita sp. 396]KAG8777168.1 hypothetical protein FRC15_011501 [Serendipita sp. 397]KAG8796189.1 hypothetical protein FRC16_009791 [Serendipita sp. 398]KAG8863896.1 hypothetical protein FRC20_010476 [Serendipita sp. 405]